jgi:hypothetical protein
MLISTEYRKLNEQLHRDMPSWGSDHTGTWMAPFLRGVIRVLDYGAGKGNFHIQGIDFRRYDPGIPEYAAAPDPADAVICNKVMEHVEPECVDAVLDHIRLLARQMVLFKISTFDSKILMADGASPHRTVMPSDWWVEKLISRWGLLHAQRTQMGLRFVGTARG